MRQLTLKGFLKTYLKYLSGENTLSVALLGEKIQTEPRLAHPLMLWAVLSGQAEVLMTRLDNRVDLLHELKTLTCFKNCEELEVALEVGAEGISEGTQKVWNSYKVRRDASLRDERLKRAAREQVLVLEQAVGVTRYRLSKDLRLNPGNLHAFLTFGDVRKLSLDKTYQLLEYLRQ